jgi:hypothetical protein
LKGAEKGEDGTGDVDDGSGGYTGVPKERVCGGHSNIEDED